MALATMPNCSLQHQFDATASTRRFDVNETSDVTRKSFTDLHVSEVKLMMLLQLDCKHLRSCVVVSEV